MKILALKNHVIGGTFFDRLRGGADPRSWHRLGDRFTSVAPTRSASRLNEVARLMGGVSSYLEIGVAFGDTFFHVQAPEKLGVDPDPMFLRERLPTGSSVLVETSDEAFQAMDAAKRFDLIFVDGYHEWRFALRDIVNSIRHSRNGTVILIDDVEPLSAEAAVLPADVELGGSEGTYYRPEGHWSGDVFRAIVALHELRPDLELAFVGSNTTDDVTQALVLVDASDVMWASSVSLGDLEKTFFGSQAANIELSHYRNYVADRFPTFGSVAEMAHLLQE